MNVTVAQNVENFNKSCSKAVENITQEFNVLTNESATMNGATTVLCSSALLTANDNMLVIMYGSSCFMNSISGFGPPPPMNSTGPFGDQPAYPKPQSPMPAPPANGAPAPYPPAISVQSRYARTVITRMLSDLLQLTRGVEDFKETTGSTCESVSESQITKIKESFINVTIILTKYENQTATTRLVTVLTASELVEINRAVTIITETVEFVKNSMRNGVKEVKTSRKPNAYQKIVQEVRENRRTSEEFSKKVTAIRKNNEKSGRRFVGRAFSTARESSNKAYKTINDARISLADQSKVMMKTVRDNGYWIYEYIVKPKLITVQTKLDTIPICLTTMFSNLNINITNTHNNTEITNNNTYHNASTFISNSITVLTDIIAKDCTCKINCAQASNEELQEIHCKFHRDSKNCMEQASALNQKAVTNCTNTTITISESMNDMVSKCDKCIRDTGAPNTYYVNFLSYIVRQNVVACLDPVSLIL